MNLTVKRVGPYYSVTLENQGTTMELGLLDDKEALSMAEDFANAAYQLGYKIPE